MAQGTSNELVKSSFLGDLLQFYLGKVRKSFL